MRPLVKRYYEKYALQEIDTQLKNTFFSDIASLDKLSYVVMMCLKRFGCFILSRTMYFKDETDWVSTIHYVLYDSRVTSYYSNISTLLKFEGMPPESCSGYAKDNNVVIYLGLISEDLPFSGEYRQPLYTLADDYDNRNAMSTEESDSLIKDIASGITLSDCLVKCSGQNNVNTNKIISKFKTYIDKLNEYYLPYQRKLKNSLSLSSNRLSDAFDTLEHELTHVYDRLQSHSVNHFSLDRLDAKQINLDETKFNAAKDILYMLWSYTEMNAYAHTYGRQRKISPVKIKDDVVDPKRKSSDIRGIYKSLDETTSELNDEIRSLENYDDEKFWNTVKFIVVKGNKIQDVQERIEKMGTSSFKTYFIKTSYKLLEKYKNKTVKKSTQQALYNNDSLLLAKEIRRAIDRNNRTYYYKKKLPFEFKMTFQYYFKDEGSAFDVTLIMSSDDTSSGMYSRDLYFYKNTDIVIQCKKISIDYKLSLSDLLSCSGSFFDLYCELVNKPQRKSYFDKTAISMADDLRFIIDKRIE